MLARIATAALLLVMGSTPRAAAQDAAAVIAAASKSMGAVNVTNIAEYRRMTFDASIESATPNPPSLAGDAGDAWAAGGAGAAPGAGASKPNEHSDGMLAVLLPAEKVLWTADITVVNPN